MFGQRYTSSAPANEREGLVIVNTGTGKGKSTAAFGMGLRVERRRDADFDLALPIDTAIFCHFPDKFRTRHHGRGTRSACAGS
jgi:hypothetical protein